MGAAIGAIAGKGNGAPIGGAAGASAGTAAQVLTRGQKIRVPSDTVLEFQLKTPLKVMPSPDRGAPPKVE